LHPAAGPRRYNGAAMTRERTDSRTEANLLVALVGEADANRRSLACGIQALNEDRPDIAQLFFEAAGRSGLEVVALAAASGTLSFGLGRLPSLLLGVDVGG
jgi:hypothetical protein